MIVVKLREAMEVYRRRTGRRITYEQLAAATGLSRDTIQSIASRPRYNATLETIGRLCRALGCRSIDELLEYCPPEAEAPEQNEKKE